METRLTLRPGQNGTKKLLERWRPAQKLWEITWGNAKRLGITERVPASDVSQET